MQTADKTDRDVINTLVTDHLMLVGYTVHQVGASFPSHVDRQELWNAGAAGLVEAANRYDPETGVPFRRYASIRIRGAILDSVRQRDWATRRLRRDMRETRLAARDFEAHHGRHASDEELAAALRITVEELCQRRADAKKATLLHLDQPVGAADDTAATLGDFVQEDQDEHLPEDALEQRELIGTLRSAISYLPEQQFEIIQRYYFGGELLRDIADELGVTEARISQIRSEALTALRAYFGDAFEGVPEVDENAPGSRARAAFVAAMSEHSTWQARMAAADEQGATPVNAGLRSA